MDQSLAVLDQLLKQINRGAKWITRTSPRYRGKMAEEPLHRMTKASAAAGGQDWNSVYCSGRKTCRRHSRVRRNSPVLDTGFSHGSAAQPPLPPAGAER